MPGLENSENVGIALALVLAAGASTGLGAAVVFFPSIVKLASRRVLAGSLGFSAGVMTYVSFVEIFQKAQLSFAETHDAGKAYLYSSLTFFAGVLIMTVLNLVVAKLLGGHSHRPGGDSADAPNKRKKKAKRKDVKTPAEDIGAYDPPCCNKDPVGQLENFKTMASVLQHEKDGENTNDDELSDDMGMDMDMDEDIEDDFVDNLPLDDKSEVSEDNSNDEEQNRAEEEHVDPKTTEENKRLVKMGMNTALAIGLHNFPEGLATFVAAVEDPKVGSVLALAIAIHNIPEGLCVALPIFYATGNRLNAFLWALLSGASELVAALLGWAILASAFNDNTYGILFGMVAGMMVIISIRELLPTAHFYDPEDTVVTFSYIAGMALMAMSLVLFQL